MKINEKQHKYCDKETLRFKSKKKDRQFDRKDNQRRDNVKQTKENNYVDIRYGKKIN